MVSNQARVITYNPKHIPFGRWVVTYSHQPQIPNSCASVFLRTFGWFQCCSKRKCCKKQLEFPRSFIICPEDRTIVFFFWGHVSKLLSLKTHWFPSWNEAFGYISGSPNFDYAHDTCLSLSFFIYFWCFALLVALFIFLQIEKKDVS